MALLEQVTKLENLQLAEARARRGKARRTKILKFDEHKDQLLEKPNGLRVKIRLK